MKKGIVILFFVLASSGVSLHASNLILNLFLSQGIFDVIQWKVGDYSNYNLELGFLGKGTVSKIATKEEGNAIWLTSDIKTAMGNQKVETLVSRSNGKILKLIVDGKEQKYEEHEIEIISKEASEITVPAGTFKAIHVKIKDKTDGSDIEAWINPKDIVLEGIAKSIVKKSILTVTMELTSFGQKSE